FHERVWGALSLAPIYSREIGSPIGEAWLTGEECLAENGPLSGRTLASLVQEFGEALVGDGTQGQTRFPLLIKFLFPRDKLSVQVHPDDEIAQRNGQASGKTECWYVLSAEAGAQVGLGLKTGTTKAEVERAIREARMEELLNWIDVRRGDMIYVDAGTVHAIGPGSVIVETQQNSDTTYRLYDYGRARELHIQDGLAATKEHTRAGKVFPGQPVMDKGKSQSNLITSPCFVVDKFKLSRAWEFQRPSHADRSVWCMVMIQGCGVLEAEGLPALNLCTGEAIVVPAAVNRFILKPEWEMEFLCSSLPRKNIRHSGTVLLESTAGASVPKI
ncbi:MAG: type I phosphomannose isomerase catalytic subunit, partial [Candidatus Angelobacter sp.]